MRNFHILLVEDNEGDVYLTTDFLESELPSLQLMVLKDGEDAINYFKSIKLNTEQIPDLVLLDINLPKKSGHEVLQFIYSIEEFKSLPIFMLSTSSSPSDLKSSEKYHAEGFIIKPLNEKNSFSLLKKLHELSPEIVLK